MSSSSGDRPAGRKETEPERRHLTVLFADLVGSTKLSSELDPEDYGSVIRAYQEACAAVISRYDGFLAQYLGDGVLAYFGYPHAHENDGERAVHAGREMIEAVSALALPQPGLSLKSRIGIATGEVVVGDTIGEGTSQVTTATGETPNLAARLQALAEPNAVVIADSTYRQVAALFDCTVLDPLQVKGISQPVSAYRVQRERDAVKQAPKPLIGRRAELEQFAGAVKTCRDTGRGQSIYVRGEAGIGKSRLVTEMNTIAKQAGFTGHTVLVLDFGARKGHDAIRALVLSLLRTSPGSNEDARRVAADRAIAENCLQPEQRVFLNDLLELPQPKEMRSLYDAMDNATRNRGKREVVAHLIKYEANRHPILITVEDIQWADPVTLAHLSSIAGTVKDCPAIFLMTGRIEGDPLDQSLLSNTYGCPLTTINLVPLNPDEAVALAGRYTDVTSRFARTCIQRAAGNPLFLEQLLRHAEQRDDGQVPASIQSLVLARLDRLAPADKKALRAASVIGQRFSLDTIRYLVDAPDYNCTSLIEQNFVRPVEDDYLFTHALIRDGIYSAILKSRRRELHRSVAGWFSERDAVLHAKHLDCADDPAAPRAHLDAARLQAAEYRYERARELVERGLELATEKADQFALACLQGELLHHLGEISGSIDIYKTALELAGDAREKCRAWIGLAEGMRVQDSLNEALTILTSAEAAATSEALNRELADIHHLRGNLYFPLGKIEDCRREHDLALDYARKAESPEAEALALGGLADAEYARGRVITALNHFRQCIAYSQEHGFGRIEVANYSMLAGTRLYCSELQGAVDDGLSAIKLAQSVADHRAELVASMCTAYPLLEMGEFAASREHVHQAQDLVRQLGAWRFEARNLCHLGRILYEEGRHSDAAELLHQALKISRDTAVTFTGPRILAALALVLEDPDARRTSLQEGEDLLRQGCVSHNHFWFYRDGMEAALRIGDLDTVERYAAALEDYTRPEPLSWTDFFIARGRALADYKRGNTGEKTMQALKRLHNRATSLRFEIALPALNKALST